MGFGRFIAEGYAKGIVGALLTAAFLTVIGETTKSTLHAISIGGLYWILFVDYLMYPFARYFKYLVLGRFDGVWVVIRSYGLIPIAFRCAQLVFVFLLSPLLGVIGIVARVVRQRGGLSI